MDYSKIISYIYALLAVGYGTYFFIVIYFSEFSIIRGYNYRKETIGIIKTINCYDKNNCDGDIEYTVNNTKYLAESIKIPNNSKIGDTIKLRYSPNIPRDVFAYGNMHIYSYVYMILLIIAIILLWIFLFIAILYKNIYNKFIFLIYAIFITVIISYIFYLNIYNNYNNDLFKYDKYDDYTIGIIKSQDNCFPVDYDDKINMCDNNIEYFIDGIKYNVKLLLTNYKVGEEVKVYYYKNDPKAIEIYDKTDNERLIKIIAYIIVLILLWIFLFFNISFILN